MSEISSKELAKAACKALADRRGRDIVTIYVRDKTVLCDYFVLASGSSSTQIRALGEHVEEKIESLYNLQPTKAFTTDVGQSSTTAMSSCIFSTTKRGCFITSNGCGRTAEISKNT